MKRDKLDKKAKPSIVIDHNYVSKAYRIYLAQDNKVTISRDVQFFESYSWNCENDLKLEFKNEDIYDKPIRGTRAVFDNYKRSNVVTIELVGYEEVETNKRWVAAIKRGFEMIEKNQTWMLADIPT